MTSRGLWHLMSARARRGLALSWSALFVLSLLLQYFSFALAPATLALTGIKAGTIAGFEVDGELLGGNGASNPVGIPAAQINGLADGIDWRSATHGATIDDQFNSASDVWFKQGKELDTTNWSFQTKAVTPSKDDIRDVLVYTTRVSGDAFLFIGATRIVNNGDTHLTIELNRKPFKTWADGVSKPDRSVGDVFIDLEFATGGAVPDVLVYKVIGVTTSANGQVVTIGPDVATQAALRSATNFAALAGASNGLGYDLDVNEFSEFGVDLTALGIDTGCPGLSNANIRTRAGGDALGSSDVKDFTQPIPVDLNNCAPPTMTTLSSKSVAHFGESVTDTASLTGQDGPASGSVKFFVCGPSGSAPDCSSGGTQVGGSVAVTTSQNGGTATSAAFTPATAGTYCFRAVYTPDEAAHYLGVSHTNQTTECFTLVKNPTAIATAENQTVNVGQSISDSATLSGATADAGGSIVFRAYGPGDGNCSNAPAFTSASFPVSGNGTYGPATFTPSTAGNYRWIASYGGDAKNLASIGQCNDEGELDTVNKVNPTIATQASADVVVGGQIHDTATVSGGQSPTGTVTFNLYGPNDATCANAAIFTSGPIALSGGSATSGNFTTTQVGTYRWRATYNGDVNNNAVTGACNAANENVVVNPASPAITTSLSGDGKTGASITVPLGTAVHDSSTLTGATATAGGTVHYQVFTDPQCQVLLQDAGTKTVLNHVVPNSNDITFIHAGTYYWQADYSGDPNNSAASSACNLETVTVDKNIPAIVTNASGTVEVGGVISDSATLSGGFSPTGSITFKLYGPNDATCAGAMAFTSTVAVNGNGVYPSGNFTTTAAGTYRWVASYSGDGDNAAVSGGCNDQNENVVVAKRNPTVVTTASASVQVGNAISDSATLAGGYQPTGTITFNLYGPSDANCTGAVKYTNTVTVSGNGTYGSGNYTATAAGTYHWIANYSGDANNNATANGCNGANENVVVTPRNPTVVTTASATVVVGGKISDSAVLAGGFSPTGSITFNLYGPDDATCSGAVKFTATVTVNGNGTYGSGDFTTTAAGTYRWIANYSGDANNNPTANGCNAANENVIVTKASPTIATLATDGAQVGDQIHDVATVSGGSNPTGTVTFKLYGPTDPNCNSAAIFTSAVPLSQNGTATSGTYTVTEKGNYHWVASYGGDANNESATGACGDQGETTVVNQFNPDITTTLHSGNISGAKITVLFGSTVTDQAVLTGASPTAGGTVTYTVYTDNACHNVFADAGSKTVTNGVVPASNPVNFPNAGTYYWQASYGGDSANAPATSVCTDEVLTVTTPDLDIEKLVAVNDGAFVHSNSAQPGDTLHYRITVHNSGNATATNVPVSDDISAILAHATYNADCSNGCGFAGDTLTWTIPSIAAGATVTLTFSVTLDDSFPAGQTILPNVVVATGPGSNCEADSEDADCATDTTVAAAPDLDVEKLVAVNGGAFVHSNSAQPGDTLHYQITITNNGDADATAVPVSDDISAILAHASYNGDCSGGCQFAGDTLTWTIPTIAANGGSVTLTFSVTLDETFPGGQTVLPNVVVVTGQGSNCGADSEDADCATDTTVGAQPDLDVTKLVATGDDDFGPASVATPGDTLNYQITISNTGNADATNVPVSDNISALLAHGTYNGDCNLGCTFAAGTLTWTIPTIAAGGSVTLTFSVDLDDTFPTGTTHLPNVVVVTGPGSNCAAVSEDPDCDTTTTVTTSLLTIDKDFTGNTAGTDPDLGVPAAHIGDTLHYTLTYHGEGPLTNAVITDVLPAGLDYVVGSAAGDTHFTFIGYTPATRTLRWESANLLDPQQDEADSVDGAVTYDVKVLQAAPGFPQPLVNTATIGSDQTEPDSDTASVAVLAPPEELTPPPTSTITPPNATSNPGFALMLILLGVAGLALGIGFVTPVPARVRRRDRLG